MGVADSPDLANLYGCHFEAKAGIMTDERVAFYGRYIDDCFSIVRAKSSDEAERYIDSKIRFDGCQILWDSSPLRCNFLDATFYFNERGTKLEWRPYRKGKNHLERIPWISHHPLDVKRGTFTGEMSRLATLSSTYSVYLESVHDLVCLYVKRGYPQDLISNWVRRYLTERWEKRLSEKNAEEDGNVLVLKSEFNTAWNWFNAKELGDIILGYWKDWHAVADAGHDMKPSTLQKWPRPALSNIGSLGDTLHQFKTLVKVWPSGEEYIPDVRLIGLTDKRLIVSRKRTRNMFDFTSLWKKEVFSKLDEAVLEERDLDAPAPPVPEQPTTASSSHHPPLGTDPRGDSDDDVIYVNYNPSGRRSPGLGRGTFG